MFLKILRYLWILWKGRLCNAMYMFDMKKRKKEKKIYKNNRTIIKKSIDAGKNV